MVSESDPGPSVLRDREDSNSRVAGLEERLATTVKHFVLRLAVDVGD